MRYRSQNIRVLNRLRHAETCVSSTGKPMPYPRSKNDPLARNERAPIDMGAGGRRTLWERPR